MLSRSRKIVRGDIPKVPPFSRLTQDYEEIATFSWQTEKDVILYHRVFLKKSVNVLALAWTSFSIYLVETGPDGDTRHEDRSFKI